MRMLMSGVALLAAGLISEKELYKLPKGRKGRQPKARSKYMPHQSTRECERRIRQMKRV